MAIIRKATRNKNQQSDAQYKTLAGSSGFCISKKHVRLVKIQRRASKRTGRCFTRRNQRDIGSSVWIEDCGGVYD